MKTLSAVLLVCFVTPVFAQKNKTKISDVDAIKSVIEQETQAFFDVNYEKWMESWIHTPSAYWSYADATGTNYYDGWNAIEIGFTDYFITSKPSNIKIERTWQEVKVYDKGAYARFKQRIITDGIPGPDQVEIRLLEKDESNNWKILLVGVLKSNPSVLTATQHD